MADSVIPKETLEAVALSTCPPPACTKACAGCLDIARDVILAYHADLARRWLKVVARVPSAAMVASSCWQYGDGITTDAAFERMWDAAESVL